MKIAQKRLLALLSYGPVTPGGDSVDPASRRPLSNAIQAWSDHDWEDLAAEARRHSLGPLLHHKLLSHLPAETVPAHVSGKLRNEYLRSAAVNMRRYKIVSSALKALETAGLPTIVLKGAYLAEAVYDNIALRPMADVDILVHREDLGRANTALSSAGFTPREFQISPPKDENEFHYHEKVTKTLLEVHWEMTKPDYPFTLNVRDLWEAAVPARIAGVDVLALSPEDLLIFLGLHATTHRYSHGLRPLCDIAEVVSRLEVDWNLLGERIRRNGVGRSVRVPLSLAQELLQAAIPEEAMRRLQTSPLPEELWEEAKETILLNSPGQAAGETLNPNLVLFFGRKRWRDKLPLLFRRVFPSREMIAAMYPVRANSPRVLLFYPSWFRVLFKRNTTGLRRYLSPKSRRSSAHKKAAALMDWLMTRED